MAMLFAASVTPIRHALRSSRSVSFILDVAVEICDLRFQPLFSSVCAHMRLHHAGDEPSLRYARPLKPTQRRVGLWPTWAVAASSLSRLSPSHCVLRRTGRLARRRVSIPVLRASSPRRTQKAAFAATRKTLKWIWLQFAQRSTVAFGYDPKFTRSSLEPLPCRGHLAQTAGRGGAETLGEGRPDLQCRLA